MAKMTEASRQVCLRCGLGLAWWRGTAYKHLASGSTGPSCGRKPIPVLRSYYEGTSYDLANRRKRDRPDNVQQCGTLSRHSAIKSFVP